MSSTVCSDPQTGAAKIAEYPDAFFALRLCGDGSCASRLLQTHPHGPAAASGVQPVESITYSGTHPVSRLQPHDAALDATGLNATLFAYSSLVAANMTASARPAAAFTLTVDNSAGSSDANASLLLSMPLQIETDQSRPGTPLGSPSSTTDSSACAALCEATTACLSWNFIRSTAMCQLQSSGNLNRYSLGTDSGRSIN